MRSFRELARSQVQTTTDTAGSGKLRTQGIGDDRVFCTEFLAPLPAGRGVESCHGVEELIGRALHSRQPALDLAQPRLDPGQSGAGLPDRVVLPVLHVLSVTEFALERYKAALKPIYAFAEISEAGQ
jgi:hypothetical protein